MIYIYKITLKEKYHDFSAWDEKVQQAFKRHAEFLEKETKSNVVFVGRTDVDLKNNFGLVVFKAESLEAAQNFMNKDPVVEEGIMDATVYPFKLLAVTDEAKKFSIWQVIEIDNDDAWEFLQERVWAQELALVQEFLKNLVQAE